MISYDHEELSTAAAHLMRKIIESVTDIDNIKDEREKYEAKRKADPAAKMRPFPFIWEKIGMCLSIPLFAITILQVMQTVEWLCECWM